MNVTVRRHLSADAMIRTVRASFEEVGETRRGRPQIAMEDVLMSSYAMFSLKDSSLLAFERRRTAQEHNLKTIYKLKTVPSDTQIARYLIRLTRAKVSKKSLMNPIPHGLSRFPD